MIFWQVVAVLCIGSGLTVVGAIIGGAIAVSMSNNKKEEPKDEQTR